MIARTIPLFSHEPGPAREPTVHDTPAVDTAAASDPVWVEIGAGYWWRHRTHDIHIEREEPADRWKAPTSQPRRWRVTEGSPYGPHPERYRCETAETCVEVTVIADRWTRQADARSSR